MTFFKSERAIEEMIKNRALQTRIARGVVRKAGLPIREIPGVTLQGPHTIIDAYIHPPGEVPLAREYRANLATANRVRLSSQSAGAVFVLYSTSVESGPLDPGDWQPLSDTSGTPISSSQVQSGATDPLRWSDVAEEARTDVRLVLSTSTASPRLDERTPFAVALQVDG